jgi:LmbE family N-acetylglucosaminyl deacetylase
MLAGVDGPPLVVAAHPDDEVIGAGALLAHSPGAVVVHVTDGAPRDPADARTLGFTTRADYARARREEAERSLALAGVPPSRLLSLGIVDQEATARLVEVVGRLAAELVPREPAWLLTHPFEGGHPDHDATALAVHALVARWPASRRRPALWELTSYHQQGEALVWGLFLPGDTEEQVHALDEAARAHKVKMLAAFATQARVLADFPVGPERFRPAPRYRFTEPPHAGPLGYERFAWAGTFPQWGAQAERALAALGLPPDQPL